MFSEDQLYPESSDWLVKVRNASTSGEFAEALELFLNLVNEDSNLFINDEGKIEQWVGEVDRIRGNVITVYSNEGNHVWKPHFHVKGPDVDLEVTILLNNPHLPLLFKGYAKDKKIQKEIRVWWEEEGNKSKFIQEIRHSQKTGWK